MRITKEHMPWGYPIVKKLRGGYLWICPRCGTVNAWNATDAARASKKLKADVVVCSGSAFDHICGECRVDIVQPESPINAECYTHEES